MKITAGTDQQTELTRKDRQAANLIGRLVPVDHFNRVTPSLNIVANQPSALAAGEIVVRGVRQADPGPCCAQGGDGVFKGRPVQLDVAQLAGAQPLAERFGAIFDVTGLDQKVGKVRTRRGIATVAQGLLDGSRTFKRTGHALEREFAADLFGAQPAAIVQFGNGLDQRWRVHIKPVAKHMYRRPAPGAGQFHAVDQRHAQRLRRCAGFVEAFKCIVIGQGQDSHTFLERTRDQYRRRQGAIGCRAMAMQVNFHGDLITSS